MNHSKNKTRIKVEKPSRSSSYPKHFSNKKSPNRHSSTTSSSHSSTVLPHGLKLHTRSLMTAFVNHSKETSLWITTINTNQGGIRQSKKSNSSSLQAFSFRTEHEARESAYVNAPPQMIPFSLSLNCFVCESKFNSMFRRPSHCRNCGVAICNSCNVSWKKVMVPETYNPKKTKTVKVCQSCDYLSKAFRHYLCNGNYDAALKIYMTGNINLRCPFENVKKGEEIM